MLRLKLIRQTDSEVVYNYFPEQEDKHGTITIEKATGKISNTIAASNDKYKRYLFHAVSRIEKYFSEEEYLEEDIVAWR